MENVVNVDACKETREKRKRSRMLPNSEFETAEGESGVDDDDEDNPAPPMPVLPLCTQLSPLSSYAIASPMRA